MVVQTELVDVVLGRSCGSEILVTGDTVVGGGEVVGTFLVFGYRFSDELVRLSSGIRESCVIG